MVQICKILEIRTFNECRSKCTHTSTHHSHTTQTASALLILYNLLGFAKQLFFSKNENKNIATVSRVQFLRINQIKWVNHAKATTITKTTVKNYIINRTHSNKTNHRAR